MHAAGQPHDLDLLVAEVDLIWGRDNLGKDPASPCVVVAVTPHGTAVVCNPDLPGADDLRIAAAAQPAWPDPSQPSDAVRACRGLLERASGPTELTSGPTYRISPPCSVASDRTVLLSTNAEQVDAVRDVRPQNWAMDEWRELLAGSLGPWAPE